MKKIVTTSLILFSTILVSVSASASTLSAIASTGDAHSEEVHRSEAFPEKRSVGAVSEYQPHIGIMAGTVSSNNADSTYSEMGFDFGYQPYIPFGLGFEATGSKFEDTDGEIRSKTNLILKGSYNFGGDVFLIKNSFVGLAADSIILRENSDFCYGPLLGFDIPVTEDTSRSHITIGANAKYLFTDDTPTEGLAVNGAVKYWF